MRTLISHMTTVSPLDGWNRLQGSIYTHIHTFIKIVFFKKEAKYDIFTTQ